MKFVSSLDSPFKWSSKLRSHQQEAENGWPIQEIDHLTSLHPIFVIPWSAVEETQSFFSVKVGFWEGCWAIFGGIRGTHCKIPTRSPFQMYINFQWEDLGAQYICVVFLHQAPCRLVLSSLASLSSTTLLYIFNYFYSSKNIVAPIRASLPNIPDIEHIAHNCLSFGTLFAVQAAMPPAAAHYFSRIKCTLGEWACRLWMIEK